MLIVVLDVLANCKIVVAFIVTGIEFYRFLVVEYGLFRHANREVGVSQVFIESVFFFILQTLFEDKYCFGVPAEDVQSGGFVVVEID
jgi:hypothetical protein